MPATEETVTVTFTRKEYDALVEATERLRDPLTGGSFGLGPDLSLREFDAREAAVKLEAAGRRPLRIA